jgi:UDP-GlcNAc:undecaprenyl-phosphate/decaprenyl-phosphate GlcNAc-1-phosphate transferase
VDAICWAQESGFKVYVLVSLGLFAFLVSLNLTPIVRNLALRFGIVDQPDGRRKLHGGAIPRVGGIAILISYLLAFAATAFGFMDVGFVLPHESMVSGLLLAVGLVFATGLLDDLFHLKPWQKLAGQVLAAGVAYWSGVQIHLLRGFSLDGWVSCLLTVIWLVLCANAFNLIDGLDGLAAGVGVFATITILIAALTQHNLALAVATVPLVGCLLGFLRYNFNPASIFLGDCGSLTIGFFLGCCGVLWEQKSATLVGMMAPLMAMAIPLLDTGLSIARRLLRNQPVFSPDRRHIHHLLLDRGLTPRRASLLLYGGSALAATFSLLQETAYHQFGGVIIILFCAAAWIGVQYLGYSEFRFATRLLFQGARQIIDTQFRLQGLERSLTDAETVEQCWEAIEVGCRDLGLRGARMCFQGRAFESIWQGSFEQYWQIRVPLPEGQYVNLYRDRKDEDYSCSFAEFARILQSTLRARLQNTEKPLLNVAPRSESLSQVANAT